MAITRAYRIGRSIARNKTLIAGVVAAVFVLYWVATNAFRAIQAQEVPPTVAAAPVSATPVAKPPPPNPLKLKCTDGMSAIFLEAQAAMKKKNAKAAFALLDPCKQYMTDQNAIALHRAAMVILTKEVQLANAKRERAIKAEKRKHGVSIGMSQQDAIDSSWGKPRKINRTTTALHVREQWVYDGGYLYFTDGVLTSIQN